MTRARPVVLCVLLLVAGASLAGAQSLPGEFARFESWWLHPTQGTLGISYDGTQIRIDRDGDGGTESLFLRPTGPTGIPDAAIGSLRLTPTRTIVYAFGGTCQGDGMLVHFYRVPAGFGENRLEPIRTGLCIPNGVSSPPGFYDTGRCEFNGIGLDCDGRLGVSPRRIAVFTPQADEFGHFNLIWVDLVTGATSGPGFDFESGFGFLHVSPSGTQAFLQHDLAQIGDTDYRLIDLCPGSLGTVINQGGFPITDVNEVLSAEVASVAGGVVNVQVKNGSGAVRLDADLTDCLDAPGACCFEAGGCYDTGTATQCSGGSFLGPGSACSACPTPPVEVPCCFAEAYPGCTLLGETSCSDQGGTPHPEQSFCSEDLCPQPEPAVVLTGPAAASVGDTVAYQLTYENAGGVIARNVEIQIQPPYGALDVSATDGGDVQQGLISWVIGDLAPGAGATVGFSFTIGCDGTYVSLQALIGHSPPGGGGVYYPSNTIQYEAVPPASAALAIAVATQPAREPLRPGDELEHTITIDNPSAQVVSARLGTSSSAVPDPFPYGAATDFDHMIDAAGGNAVTTGGEFDWSGSVPPGQTQIRFVTRVDGCVPAGTTETSLNFATPIAAFDQCNTSLGASNEPASFALANLVDVAIAASNLSPPQHVEAPAVEYDVQVARPGTSVDLIVAIGSGVGEAVSDATISFLLRGFDVTTPPSGPGISWNAAQRSVEWSGDVPASGAATIQLSATLAACRGEIDLDGMTAPGCTNVRAKGIVAAVPEPPPGPWLAALGFRPHPFEAFSFEEHLTRIDPGPPAQVITQLCLPGEYARGIGASPDGDVWVTWLPTYRLNPRRLEFESFDVDRLYAAGLGNLEDVAVDPGGNDVYFAGSDSDATGVSSAILRYDRAQDSLAPFFEDSAYTAIGQTVVDAQGSLAAVAYAGATTSLVRIDPSDPGVANVLHAPSGTWISDVALDADGSYLVLDGTFGPTALYAVDADTGDRDTVVADLATKFPTVQGWGQLDADAQGDLYLAPAQPGLGRLARASGDPAVLVAISNFGAGAFQDVAMVGRTAAPEPAAAALASGALAAIAGLAARRRVRRAARSRSSATAATPSQPAEGSGSTSDSWSA